MPTLVIVAESRALLVREEDSVIVTYDKDPSARLPYVVDWSLWLPVGETISAVAWTVPSGITQVGGSNTTSSATIQLSGGVLDALYRVTCRITTTPGGFIDERSFQLRIVER